MRLDTKNVEVCNVEEETFDDPILSQVVDDGLTFTPPSLIERSSSHDDDDIISTYDSINLNFCLFVVILCCHCRLMTEIVAMQKQRARRKSARAIANIARNAEVQLLNFLSQWSNFVQYHCGDFDYLYEMKLDSILVRMNPLFFNYDEITALLSNNFSSLDNFANTQLQEIASFIMESKQLLEQRANETLILKKDVENMRKETSERCHQSLYGQDKIEESEMTLLHKGKLLKALESL